MTNDQFPNDELLAFIRHSSFTHSSFSSIGEYRIRTCEGVSHQIYSLTRLTASVTHRATSNSPPSYNAEVRNAQHCRRQSEFSQRRTTDPRKTAAGSAPFTILRIPYRTH